jgi:hypothetical protein
MLLALQPAAHPVGVTLQRRPVEAEFGLQGGQRFGCGGVAEDHLGRVAGQQLQHRKDHGRSHEQGGQEGRDALEQEDTHGG